MKTSKNDITGDAIKTRKNSKAYERNHEKIFGKKKILECGNCGIKTAIQSVNDRCRYCGRCLECE